MKRKTKSSKKCTRFHIAFIRGFYPLSEKPAVSPVDFYFDYIFFIYQNSDRFLANIIFCRARAIQTSYIFYKILLL